MMTGDCRDELPRYSPRFCAPAQSSFRRVSLSTTRPAPPTRPTPENIAEISPRCIRHVNRNSPRDRAARGDGGRTSRPHRRRRHHRQVPRPTTARRRRRPVAPIRRRIRDRSRRGLELEIARPAVRAVVVRLYDGRCHLSVPAILGRSRLIRRVYPRRARISDAASRIASLGAPLQRTAQNHRTRVTARPRAPRTARAARRIARRIRRRIRRRVVTRLARGAAGDGRRGGCAFARGLLAIE